MLHHPPPALSPSENSYRHDRRPIRIPARIPPSLTAQSLKSRLNMNNKFDELTTGKAQSVTRTLLCLAAAGQFAVGARAEDLYVDAHAAPGGDGSAGAPYLRITDGVERARGGSCRDPVDINFEFHLGDCAGAMRLR